MSEAAASATICTKALYNWSKLPVAVGLTDALLLVAGDPAGEDEVIRKGTAFQVCSHLSTSSLTTHTHVSSASDMAARIRVSFDVPYVSEESAVDPMLGVKRCVTHRSTR